MIINKGYMIQFFSILKPIVYGVICGLVCLNDGDICASPTQGGVEQAYKYTYDQGYVINLDRAHERYRVIKSVLNKNKIRYKRFSAINGYQVRLIPLSGGRVISGRDLKNGTEKLVPNEKYRVLCTENPKRQKYPLYFQSNSEYYTEQTSAGELGCLCSHFLVWQDVAENDYKVALVFEDDIIGFSENFQELVSKIIEHLPEEAFVHLSPVDSKTYGEKDFVTLECKLGETPGLCKILDSTRALGMFAYIINNNMAKKLLNSFNSCGPVDITLLNKVNSREISIYTSFPLPLQIENDYEQSLIAHM